MGKLFKYSAFSLLSFLVAGIMIIAPTTTTSAATKGAPKELKVAFVDFFSGGAAVFGVSGKGTSELLVAKWNKSGGIGGVAIKLIVVDEGGGQGGDHVGHLAGSDCPGVGHGTLPSPVDAVATTSTASRLQQVAGLVVPEEQGDLVG